MNIYEKLTEIQQKLKAPKNQFNTFGGYHYRSCEDILEALKPLLNGIGLHINDDVVEVGGRVYVRATVTLTYSDQSISVSGFAREEETKKGMDGSQITGAASSYARKYALNGLFLIDDNKDSDTTNKGEEKPPSEPKKPPKTSVKPNTITDERRAKWAEMMERYQSIDPSAFRITLAAATPNNKDKWLKIEDVPRTEKDMKLALDEVKKAFEQQEAA
jgi:hypothetical protein